MYSFEDFGLRQMIESGKILRGLAPDSRCMEEAAREVVDFLYDSFRTKAGDPACALVRCFKTHRYSELPGPLRDIAASAMNGAIVDESMICLTLLATRGIEPEWNSRHASVGHHAIPLATAEMVAQAPMIARAVQQMGLEARDLLNVEPKVLDEIEKRTLDVFHIEQAVDSVFVPAQAGFVKPYGVRSVLGFGGLLPTGDLFFFVLFARVPISAETASRFRTLAICTKLLLLSHIHKPVFAV